MNFSRDFTLSILFTKHTERLRFWDSIGPFFVLWVKCFVSGRLRLLPKRCMSKWRKTETSEALFRCGTSNTADFINLSFRHVLLLHTYIILHCFVQWFPQHWWSAPNYTQDIIYFVQNMSSSDESELSYGLCFDRLTIRKNTYYTKWPKHIHMHFGKLE